MRFYVLTTPKVEEGVEGVTDFLTVLPPKEVGVWPHCPACGKCSGLRIWQAPYVAEIEFWTAVPGDIAFGGGDELLVSERFRDGFLAEGLSGLEGFGGPVTIERIYRYGRARRRKGWAGPTPPDYYCARPVMGPAAIDESASELVRQKGPWTCEVCRTGDTRSIKRVVLEPGTWAGEDIFLPRGLGSTLVSERFRDWYASRQFLNGTFIPAEQYGFDYSLYGGAGAPGTR